MSFITRCPACHTAFKVVSDQLKISEGWVRCGHCQQVFDATLDLQPWWPDVPAETHPPEVSLPVNDAAVFPESESSEEASANEVGQFDSGAAIGTETSVNEPVWRGETPDVPSQGASSAADGATHPEHSGESLRESPSEVGSVAEPLAEPQLAACQNEPALSADISAEEAPTPSFVRQAERKAFWRRPAVRWGLAVASVLLVAGLTVQAALHWRDPLSARAPQTQPALEKLCEPLDCKIEPPRQLENIVIDSSVLLRRAPGRYTFNVVVRNTSDMELTTPALELTLTDLQDQVVVRRVLLAQEWPEPRATLAPGAEWPVQFELELESPQAQVMTGYRAILFYP